jgi:hypothetical protein
MDHIKPTDRIILTYSFPLNQKRLYYSIGITIDNKKVLCTDYPSILIA